MKYIYLLSILILGILIKFLIIDKLFINNLLPNRNATPTINYIYIDNKPINIELANTPEKQAQGLSGRTELKEGTGMLFPYNPPQMVTFWMRDMLIPIDMIFIANGKVVKIYQNVQPEPDMPLNHLKLYSPEQPIDFVLEVPAGWCEKNEVKVGSFVNYKPTPDQSPS